MRSRRLSVATLLAGSGLLTAIPAPVASALSVGNPHAYVARTPCRVADTRQTGGPTGPITSAPMTITVTGAAYAGVPAGANPCTAATGAPAGANAVAVNFTMANVAGPADLRVAPGGVAPTSSVMNSSGSNIANAVVVPVDGSGNIVVKSGGANFNLIIDVLGYYSYSQSGLNGFEAQSLSGNRFGLYIDNADPTCTSPCNYIDSASSTGAEALQVLSTDLGAEANIGIHGESDSTGPKTAGVRGIAATSTTSDTFGVVGRDFGTGLNSAGVAGMDSAGQPSGSAGIWDAAGVRGDSNTNAAGYGVIGTSNQLAGVSGSVYDGTGAYQKDGVLGYFDGAAYWGVFGHGDIGSTGTKSFIEPHPTDRTKEIHYVCLEGPESGTYFRGSGQVVDGFATIAVPESFRDVSDADGITVQLTPVGDLATMAVIAQDLSTIVVKASSDVRFHYLVQGVRKAFRDFQPIVENRNFVPRGPNDPHFFSLPAESQRRLVATGIYNADGTVNRTTAREMGWDAAWARRAQAAKAAADAASAAFKAEQNAQRAAKAPRP